MAAIEFISKIKPNRFALLIFIEHLVFDKPTLVSVIVSSLSCIICFVCCNEISQPFNTMQLNGYFTVLLVMFNSAVLKFVTG